MNHETVVGIFSEYLEELLSPLEVQDVERHIGDCEICINGADIHRSIHMAIRDDPSLVDDSPGPSSVAMLNIERAIDEANLS